MDPVILSIMILTRNRKKEVIKALRSCVECSLPPKMEFVIVDNGSDDGTQDAVDHFFKTNMFEYQYHYLDENIGAAAGRNEGFRWAKGRYIYFMDDDAYIDGPKKIFFKTMIDFLKANDDVFCITTSIYDTAINGNRTIATSKTAYRKYKRVLMFHGGSFFIDRQRCLDQNNLFLAHQFWGMEELYPSLKNNFNDKHIIEMNDLKIIHDPSNSTRFDRKKRIIFHYAGAAHVKLIFYPFIVYPLLYAMFFLRIVKHLGVGDLGEAFGQLSLNNKNLSKEPVPLQKFLEFVKEFGFVATF